MKRSKTKADPQWFESELYRLVEKYGPIAAEQEVGYALRTACNKLIREGRELMSSEVSAGVFKLGTATGPDVQVFVRVCRFDKDLLKADPETGGLLENRR